MEYKLENGIRIETKGDILLVDKSLLEIAPSSMFIKILDITGCILLEEELIIFGEGIPVNKEVTNQNKNLITSLPNCIWGKRDELEKIYDGLSILLQDIPNM